MPPIFELSEHSLDAVTSCLAALVILDGFLARLAVKNAGLCAHVYKGFTEAISVVPHCQLGVIHPQANH